MMPRPLIRSFAALTAACLALLMGGCGMKGPLTPATPPPAADATLMAPPTVTPQS